MWWYKILSLGLHVENITRFQFLLVKAPHEQLDYTIIRKWCVCIYSITLAVAWVALLTK